MNFTHFTDKIDHLKVVKLGGLEAQFKMAPKLRLKYDQDKILANNPRKAAVLALFYPNKDKETCFISALFTIDELLVEELLELEITSSFSMPVLALRAIL